ncbi:MAG: hypothetical protein JO149_07735, partial [Gammaproteobacteria bacterium]|nr:hypothetical protein [Gammaproteobacteria bacterium]
MKQKSLFFPLLLIFSFNASWAIDPNNLIKVVPTTATKCVEYYYYKQELYCSTTAQQAKAVDPNLNKEERQKIVFDERPWSLAWGKVTPAIITIEYVPAGEKIEQWHELITTQFIPNIQDKITLKYYLHSVIDT